MPRFLTIIWSSDPDANLEKISQHDLTPEEVEEVLLSPRSIEDVSRSSGLPLLKGKTSTGRWIVVPYELVDCDTVYPVTAYEVEG